MKWIAIISIALYLTSSCSGNEDLLITSPDKNVVFELSLEESALYSVSYASNLVIQASKIEFEFKNAPPISKNLEVLRVKKKTVDYIWQPVLKRYDSIRNYYTEMILELKEADFPGRYLNLEVRTYNDGVAFRIRFLPSDSSFQNIITDENTEFRFIGDPLCWAVDYGSFDTHQESEFRKMRVSGIHPEMITGLPLTVKLNDRLYAAITEADLTDYAGMYLTTVESKNEAALKTQLAPRHNQEREGDKVYFAGNHYTPWRVIMLAGSPGKLIESELIQNLNDACQLIDPSWIKPGVSAWDHWWSGEVKMEQDVIYEYIDLASEMGWQYMLIDWQWYGQFNTPESDITTVAPQLDMPEILNYAQDRNVRCWVWLYWTDVDKSDFDAACKLYHDWGIAGVKIDFMARDDQEMVNWYHKVVKTAAKHQLMVDFHGAYKPTGWRRSYPNLVTREGVLGNEYNKWSYRVTPEHDCTLPFTRMLAGPMDYTPGGFLNSNPGQFKTGTPARVQGTRAHELAKFVIFDSPFLVACDHPDHYKDQSGSEFLSQVQSVWDQTKVLNGEIGEYLTTARRADKKWFIGSMTNSSERTLTVSLNFLEKERSYKMISFSDNEETVRDAGKVEKNVKTITYSDKIQIQMKAGGGFAAILIPQ